MRKPKYREWADEDKRAVREIAKNICNLDPYDMPTTRIIVPPEVIDAMRRMKIIDMSHIRLSPIIEKSIKADQEVE